MQTPRGVRVSSDDNLLTKRLENESLKDCSKNQENFVSCLCWCGLKLCLSLIFSPPLTSASLNSSTHFLNNPLQDILPWTGGEGRQWKVNRSTYLCCLHTTLSTTDSHIMISHPRSLPRADSLPHEHVSPVSYDADKVNLGRCYETLTWSWPRLLAATKLCTHSTAKYDRVK